MAVKTWFKESIDSLLTAPGPLHMPKLPHGIRGGHGPIDIFSTRFANLFTDDVDASVNGETLDKAGLKDKLVILKKIYDPSSAVFTDAADGSGVNDVNEEGERVLTKLEWPNTNAQPGAEAAALWNTVAWDARVQTISGNFRKIHKLGITTQALTN